MRLSSRTEYGIRALLALSVNYSDKPMQLKKIAKSEGISLKYLEQLMTILKASGLVQTVRGSKGGYILAKPPEEIKISDCVNCLEGHIAAVECVADETICSKSSDCQTRPIWQKVSNAIEEVLKSFTLKDLVENKKKSATNYQI
jgi:Rrf2 family protein